MAVKKGTPKKKAAKSKSKKAAKKTVKKTGSTKARRPITKKTVKSSSSSLLSAKPVRISAENRKRYELLKKLLLTKRNEVVADLESQMGRKLTREMGQKIDSAMDSADQSSLEMDQGIDYSLLEMKYEQYKDIADAFRKLQNKTYGLCEECGGEINIKRLEVNPLARYCIACKTNKEAIERIQKEETRFKE